jgi:exportin-T
MSQANNGDPSSTLVQLRAAILSTFDLAAAGGGAGGSVHMGVKQRIGQANAFIEQVSALQTPGSGALEGWKYFVQLCTSEVERCEVSFFCLQRFSARAALFTPGIRSDIRRAIFQWVVDVPAELMDKVAPKFVRNKVSVLFARFVQFDYPGSWPTAFEDLLKLLEHGAIGADMYLRILKAIDEEIFEKDTQYWTDKTKLELQNNSKIKDALRFSPSVPQIVNVWYQVLSMCSDERSNEIHLAELCLKTMETWIRWIDISFVTDERFIVLLYNFLQNNTLLRDSACDCLHEVIDRGMEPRDKLALMNGVKVLTFLQENIGVKVDEDSVEMMEIVARLVDTCFMELLECREKIWEQGKACLDNEQLGLLAHDLNTCEHMMAQFMPLYWAFLAHPKYTVSDGMLESLHYFLKLLNREKKGHYIDKQGKMFAKLKLMQYVEPLYRGLLRASEYPESYSHDPDDEEDGQFDVHHAEICKAVVNSGRSAWAQAKPLMLRSIFENVVSPLSSPGGNPAGRVGALPFGRAQATLCVFFYLAEGAGTTGKKSVLNDPEVQQAVLGIHRCGVALHPDKGLLLTYYDVALRFAKPVLEGNLDVLQIVIQSLIGARGIRHQDDVVRSRSCYYLKRLSKVLRGPVVNFFQVILQAVYPLLSTPIPNPFGNSGAGGGDAVLKKLDRLLLFDLCGMLVSHLPRNEDAVHYSKLLFAPLHQVMVNGMEGLLQEFSTRGWATNSCDPEVAGNYFAEVIQSAGTATKTFPPTLPPEVRIMMRQALEASIKLFSIFLQHASVRSQVIFFFHRMISCLGNEFIQYLPPILGPILENIQADNASETIELVNQILVKYTVHLSPIITAIVIPVVQGLNRAMPKVKPRMNSSTPPTDEQQSQEELQRNYVVFLMNVVQSKLHPYLWDEKIAPNLMGIMNALVQASVDVPNAAVGKCSFFVMENLLKLWVPVQGDKIMNTAGVTSLATDVSIFSLSQENQAAFVNFSVTKMVPKSLECIIRIGFKEEDASGAYGMYKELCEVYICLYKRCGNEFIEFLKNLMVSPPYQYPAALVSPLLENVAGGSIKASRSCIVAIVKHHAMLQNQSVNGLGSGRGGGTVGTRVSNYYG